jgi:hypothetical protein
MEGNRGTKMGMEHLDWCKNCKFYCSREGECWLNPEPVKKERIGWCGQYSRHVELESSSLGLPDFEFVRGGDELLIRRAIPTGYFVCLNDEKIFLDYPALKSLSDFLSGELKKTM